jgi:hypothetical protein
MVVVSNLQQNRVKERRPQQKRNKKKKDISGFPITVGGKTFFNLLILSYIFFLLIIFIFI